MLKKYTLAKNQLAEALLFGKSDACAGLALFNQKGIGGPVSPYNQKLFLTIGSKLGNNACEQALTQLQNNNFNVEEEVNMEQEVNVWLACIDMVKKELGKTDLDTEITTQDLVDATDLLKSTLLKYHVNLNAYNSHFFVTEPELDKAANYSPSPFAQQEPHYELSYNNKDEVDATGKVPVKHHACVIL